MKILIAGYIGWNNSELIKERLELFLPMKPTICYYMKPGASLIGKVVAENLGLETELLRDDLLVDKDDKLIDLLIACHPYIRKSKSTKELIKKASQLGITYQTIGSRF